MMGRLELRISFLILITALSVLISGVYSKLTIEEEEAAAKAFLDSKESEYSDECSLYQNELWNFLIDINPATAENEIKAAEKFHRYLGAINNEVLDKFQQWHQYQDEDVKRQIQLLSVGWSGLEDDLLEMFERQSQFKQVYATTTICQHNTNCTALNFEGIEDKLRTETNYDILEYYWSEWHNKISTVITPQVYTSFLRDIRLLASANGLSDILAIWHQPYNDGSPGWTPENFRENLKSLWAEIDPLYFKILSFVRWKIRSNNADSASRFKAFSFVPNNLFGSLTANNWGVLDTLTRPNPEELSIDEEVKKAMAGWSERQIFETVAEYYIGLGFGNFSSTFWEKSVFSKPTDKIMEGTPSVHDFCKGKTDDDFRLKQNTKKDLENLMTAFNQMGKIHYSDQYKDQPFAFRDSANPAINEAIGNALGLSASNPWHLQCKMNLGNFGYVCSSERPKEITPLDINYLHYIAINKLSYLSYAMSLESWRWEAITLEIRDDVFNKRWWELRNTIAGITIPKEDTNNLFDPAGNYPVLISKDFTKEIAGIIWEFQIFEALCIEAKEYDPADINTRPLHQCDLSDKTEIGTLIKEMMQMGYSKLWPEALKIILANQTELSISSIQKYFAPLSEKVDEDLAANSQFSCVGAACETPIQEYLEKVYEEKASTMCNNAAIKRWNYQTDLGNSTAGVLYRSIALLIKNKILTHKHHDNTYGSFNKILAKILNNFLEQESIAAAIANAQFINQQWSDVFKHFQYEGFDKSKDTYRLMTFLNQVGTSALEGQDLEDYNQAVSSMSRTYGTARICPYRNQNCNLGTQGLVLDPDLELILAKMEDYDEMMYVWKAWRDATSKNETMRNTYYKYVELSNRAAELNDKANMKEYWLSAYESANFQEDMDGLWSQLKELYTELHAFVRYKLSLKFPEVKQDQPMPAHCLGNMWAQSWENVYKFCIPYPDAPDFDATPALENMTVENMFNMANMFFTETKLVDMTNSYGNNSMIERPEDGREVQCHASAWDFCNGSDFRVKMCTKKTQEDFGTVHHELGHIQYYANYNNLPISFRTGANPGFHEAIGDVISLSATTTSHLRIMGLIGHFVPSDNATINYLMKMALEKVAFLPFGFLIDSYRWQIFDGSIDPANYTYHWIKLRNEFQGIVPPTQRNETDFDAGAKYHIPGNTEYLRYFVSIILQFQIHEILCNVAGQSSRPLHECNIFNNHLAGDRFTRILQSGRSKNWQDLLDEVSDKKYNKLDAGPLISYFSPLLKYLKGQRNELGYLISWNNTAYLDYFGDDKYTPPEPPTDPPTITTTTPSPPTSPVTPGTSQETSPISTTANANRFHINFQSIFTGFIVTVFVFKLNFN